MYYCECLAINIGIIMATQIGDVAQLASYTQLINFVIVQQCFGNSYNSLLKLRINYFIACKMENSAKSLFGLGLLWYLVLYTIMFAVIWVASSKIALAYNYHNAASRQWLENLLAVYKYVVVADLLLGYVSTTARITQNVRTSLALSISIVIITQVALSMSLIKFGGATVRSILAVSHSLHLVQYSILCLIFLRSNWSEHHGKDHKPQLQEENKLVEVNESLE